MTNGWALGKFGGEFGQGVQTYAGAARARSVVSEVGQLQRSCEPTLHTQLHICPFVGRVSDAGRLRDSAAYGVKNQNNIIRIN
jgi:hypothetical protein